VLIADDRPLSTLPMPDEGGAFDPGPPRRRVLQILNSPDPGGVLALSYSITRGLAPHGFAMETMFVAPGANLSPWTKIKGTLTVLWRVAAGGHDAIMAYQPWPSVLVGLAGLIAPRTRRIVHQTTMSAEMQAPIRWLGKLLGTIGLYPVNIVNSAETARGFAAYPVRYRRHLRLIEHGVERPVVTRSRQQTLERYGIPDAGRILLHTGRLSEEKNQETLIRALAQLPDCRLVVAGEGDRREALESLARSLGVEDRVHLLGALPHAEAVQLYGIADLFVFPSLHETFGISAVEAALLGLPMLVSDIAVLREVLTSDGQSPVAFLVPTDVEAWVRQIRAWCDQPPKSRQLGDFATRLAQRYSERRMIEAYAELLSAPRR
jgi:glycosyltransferase involved in cell wall biosynthesis